MIKRKELRNRINDGHQCVGFDVQITENIKASFIRCIPATMNKWHMQVMFQRTNNSDSQIYLFDYIIPSSNLTLETIAATGLKYFQLHLKEEIEEKISVDFAIGEMTMGM